MAVELFAENAAMTNRLEQLAGAGAAPVAPQAPLLANLSALENLVLVGAFHSRRRAAILESEATALLERLGMGDSGARRPAALSARESFLVQLARAGMRPGAEVVIVTPFALVPELESEESIVRAVQALGMERVRVLDYTANRDRYHHLREAAP